ncbi:pseudouridine synthase [Arcobacter sp. 15-2]|uniref:pseudouridine synthase n=1 Tax=Arcobacter sp. 15-2 TaxID=3374109 RepID=UPI00399D29C3
MGNNDNRNEDEGKTRLNKFISHNSRFSRREADELIKAGKVSIDGKVIGDLSTKVGFKTIVKVNGRTVKVDFSRPSTVIVYNKLKGEIVSKNDPQGRKIIYDTIGKKFSHFIPVGRLDYASEGMLLLTDDPKIATAIMTSDLERVYKIKIEGEVSKAMISAMDNGITLDDATAGAWDNTKTINMEFKPFLGYQIQTSTPKYSKLKVAISEGKNRELRRFFAHFGAKVVDLKRVSFGGINLNNLPSGKVRYLERDEYDNLREFMKQQNKLNRKKDNQDLYDDEY